MMDKKAALDQLMSRIFMNLILDMGWLPRHAKNLLASDPVRNRVHELQVKGMSPYLIAEDLNGHHKMDDYE
jgi:hypothetical protein